MSWDGDDYDLNIAVVPSTKWDGEDEDENVKDNWEDDEEPIKKRDDVKTAATCNKRTKTKLEEKIEEREKRENERKAKVCHDFHTENMTAEEIQAEKLRRQKLQEEADLQLAIETLGVGEDLSIDIMHPRTKEEFAAFESALTRKICLYKKSEYFTSFVEDLIRNISANLSTNDLRKLKITIDNVINEKMKAEKDAKGGKKVKGKGKAKLRVEGNDMVYDEYSAYTVDDYDDFI